MGTSTHMPHHPKEHHKKAGSQDKNTQRDRMQQPGQGERAEQRVNTPGRDTEHGQKQR